MDTHIIWGKCSTLVDEQKICEFQVPQVYAETLEFLSLLNISKLWFFKYVYLPVMHMTDYIGNHIHLINSIRGMKHLKINTVIITVILQLCLAHFLIGLFFVQGSLPDTQCVLKSKYIFWNLFILGTFWLSWFIMGFLSLSREITWQYPTLVNSSFLSQALHFVHYYHSVTQHYKINELITVSLTKLYISEKWGTGKDMSWLINHLVSFALSWNTASWITYR
jgi:hypothetical protein